MRNVLVYNFQMISRHLNFSLKVYTRIILYSMMQNVFKIPSIKASKNLDPSTKIALFTATFN